MKIEYDIKPCTGNFYSGYFELTIISSDIYRGYGVFYNNGILRLSSVDCPAFSYPDLFIHGKREADDNYILKIHPDYVKCIIETLEQFNREFKNKKYLHKKNAAYYYFDPKSSIIVPVVLTEIGPHDSYYICSLLNDTTKKIIIDPKYIKPLNVDKIIKSLKEQDNK